MGRGMFSVLEGSLGIASVVEKHGERQIRKAYSQDLVERDQD